MKGLSLKKPELLAPAGSLEVFATAVEEGADAIYVGAPAMNARALAKHFSLEELASMIDYGHRNGVKVYLAMNSLVKEDEIAQLVELLTILEKLSPDALIIQDLGLYYLIKNYFPSLTIHASTLMGAHNSINVQQFADMGFERVVLAREMTLAEIKKIHEHSQVELEVFVHGALCFSYSGLCRFSGYLGGKSGLRGRCVQPCRRRYTWSGEGSGKGSGYFFSMNDLEAIDQLSDLTEAGVVSFKIEGRMRSANYVGSVVRAYRKVIDKGRDAGSIMPEAHRILQGAMGRKPTRGYFSSPQPADAITPFHSGNIGKFLGRVLKRKNGNITLDLQENIETGDRVRHHHEKSGERKSFTVKDIQSNGQSRKTADTGETVTLFLDAIMSDIGDTLYKVDVRSRRQMESRRSRINPSSFNRKVENIKQEGTWKNIYRKLSLKPITRQKEKKQDSRRSHPPSLLPIWLRSTDLKIVSSNVVDNPARFLVTLDAENYRQLQQQKKAYRHLVRSLTWVLPPVILEDDVAFYRKAVIELQANGFRRWMISHIGQLQLFRSAYPGKRPFISADYTFNVLNSLALRFLHEKRIGDVQLSIELDKSILENICRRKNKTQVGLTVYARPPLFTARLKPDFFKFNRTFISPRGERCELVQKWGQTLALPDKAFSLLSRQEDFKKAGVDFVVIDLSFHHFHKKEIAALRRVFSSGGKGRKESSFNFLRGLQ